MDKKRLGAWALTALTLFVFAPLGRITSALAQEDSDRDNVTPPRLSMLDGEVSYWRPGNDDWTAARMNTALAPGDALYTGQGRLEVQFGPRSYLRTDAGTQLALDNQEPDYLVFKMTNGRSTLDIRHLRPGETIELDTPQAALTIEDTGYYRVEVSDNSARFLTRRGGRARLTPARGEPTELGPSQEVVIDAQRGGQLSVYGAREIDDWDRWNYSRTDDLLAAASSQYLSDEVYGAADLDQYGTWRTVPEYGRVWAPQVSAGWVPYSTGSWAYDPYYGWTWVDTAPWGWAPFHYGRWVYLNSYWAWAPGPIIAAPYYAPALVAFFGGSGFHVGIGFGVPAVSWVALGWGEPCLPWWGHHGFIGNPWWGGWGGPHIIDHHVVHTTNVNITNINVFEHARDGRAIVSVPRQDFGRSPVEHIRLARVENQRLASPNEVLPSRPPTSARLPRQGQDPRNAVLTKPVVSAPSQRTSIDQSRGGRVAPSEPRAGRFEPQSSQPGSVSPQLPGRIEDQTRGSRRTAEPPAGTTGSPVMRSDEFGRRQPAGTTGREGQRLAVPPVPKTVPRGGEVHDDSFGRGAPVQPPRVQDQQRQGPASSLPPPVPSERLWHQRSTTERGIPQPQRYDAGPRGAIQAPPPARVQPNVQAPRVYTNRDIEAPPPASRAPERAPMREAPAPQVNVSPRQAAPAPRYDSPSGRMAPVPAPHVEAPPLRMQPAPVPHVQAPRFEPRTDYHSAPAPQRMGPVAPAPAPMPNVVPNTGGGSNAGSAPSHGGHRGGPHGR